MFEKLDPEDLKRECINAEEKSMKLYSRNAVLEDENKRLRNKFNQITKEMKEFKEAKQATIEENLKQIDKLNKNLEDAEIEKVKLQKEADDITHAKEDEIKLLKDKNKQ